MLRFVVNTDFTRFPSPSYVKDALAKTGTGGVVPVGDAMGVAVAVGVEVAIAVGVLVGVLVGPVGVGVLVGPVGVGVDVVQFEHKIAEID